MFSQVFTLKTTVFELSTDFTGVRQHFHFHFWNISHFFKLSLNDGRLLRFPNVQGEKRSPKCELGGENSEEQLQGAFQQGWHQLVLSAKSHLYISCFFGQDPSLMASVNAFSWSLQNLTFNVFKVISGEQTAKATRDQISTVTIINEAITDSQMWFNMM